MRLVQRLIELEKTQYFETAIYPVEPHALPRAVELARRVQADLLPDGEEPEEVGPALSPCLVVLSVSEGPGTVQDDSGRRSFQILR